MKFELEGKIYTSTKINNYGGIVSKKTLAKRNSQVYQIVNNSTHNKSILNPELEEKFAWIWKQYKLKNFVTYWRKGDVFHTIPPLPWIQKYDPKDFDDAKYIYLDDEHGIDGRPDFTTNDIDMLIEAKLIKSLKDCGAVNYSFCIQCRGIYFYYLILTNEGLLYFQEEEKEK